jgi:hypothetical protein
MFLPLLVASCKINEPGQAFAAPARFYTFGLQEPTMSHQDSETSLFDQPQESKKSRQPRRLCRGCSLKKIEKRNASGLCAACLAISLSPKPGETFDRWTVIAESGMSNNGKQKMFLCVCDCGTERRVCGISLTSKNSRSCGCLAGEMSSDRRSTHRMSGTPMYRIWVGMIKRCESETSKSYKRYGGRGIKVCERWRHNFEAFMADMGPRPSPKHSLDRFPNNNGNYEPGNCRWATQKEQQRNRNDNTLITFDGQTKCLAEWAEGLGVSTSTLLERLRKWTIERALTFPRRKQKRRT